MDASIVRECVALLSARLKSGAKITGLHRRVALRLCESRAKLRQPDVDVLVLVLTDRGTSSAVDAMYDIQTAFEKAIDMVSDVVTVAELERYVATLKDERP